MQDNAIFEEKVKMYYKRPESLILAYNASLYFRVSHVSESYAFTDGERVKLNRLNPLKTVLEMVMPVLQDLHQPGKYNPINVAFQMEYLSNSFPEAIRAFNMIGLKAAQAVNFDHRHIRKLIETKELNDEKTNFGLLAYIERNFKAGKNYSSKQIKAILYKGLKECKLKLLKPNVSLLKEYCELSERRLVTDHGNKTWKYQVLKIKHSKKK